MTRRHYQTYELICRVCGALNTYELPVADETIEGKPRPIWANSRHLQLGERFFPCHKCNNILKIPD